MLEDLKLAKIAYADHFMCFFIPFSVNNCKWYCTVTRRLGVIRRTNNLNEAQFPLGEGNKDNVQAIIPMVGKMVDQTITLQVVLLAKPIISD